MRNDRKKAAERVHLWCKRLPFYDHPGFLYDPCEQGYTNHTFGGRAGPHVHFSHVCHEVGHAAEFGVENFKQRTDDFGRYIFHLPEQYVLGRRCVEPETSQATQRELRVFARQLHIMRAAGYKTSFDAYARDMAEAMDYMPDYWAVPGKTKEKRKLWCVEQIRIEYERLKQQDVLDAAARWFDKIAELKLKGTRVLEDYLESA